MKYWHGIPDDWPAARPEILPPGRAASCHQESEKMEVRLMAREKKPAADLRLALTFEGDRDFAHVYARPYVLARDKYSDHDWGLWNPDYYGYQGPQATDAMRALTHLRITSQLSPDTADFYAIRPEYDVCTGVGLREAQTMLPVLRRLDSGMAKFASALGYPRGLDQHLARYAQLICPDAIVPFLVRAEPGKDFEGTGYRSYQVELMSMWINDQVEAWREKYGHVVRTES